MKKTVYRFILVVLVLALGFSACDNPLAPVIYKAEVAAPAVSPGAGAVPVGTTVTLSTATGGAVIYYTVNGADPASSGTPYVSPIVIDVPQTIRAVAKKSGMTDSGMLTAAYTIDNSTAARDFEYAVSDGKAAITGYTGSGANVVIPGAVNGVPVTSIGFGAFSGHQLVSVTIPDSVTYIGDGAFGNNPLTGVTIGGGVTLGDGAFPGDLGTVYTSSGRLAGTYMSSDGGLTWTPQTPEPEGNFTVADNGSGVFITGYTGSATDILIPGTINGRPVTAIGDNAFKGNQLTGVTIPASVTAIGGDAFKGNQLTSVTIPASVTSIGPGAFGNNPLTSVTIPGSVTSIGDNAFAFNQLTSVTIAGSVTSIGSGTFAHNQLTSLTIPASVTSIGEGAFSSNQLVSVTILGSGTSIGPGTFGNNPLTSVTIGADVTLGDGAFPGNLETVYTSSGRLAETYISGDGGNTWSKQTSFVAVTSINGVPTTGTAGEALTLGGTISPVNATNKAILWSVKSAGSTGAVINGNTLTAAAGTVTVTATIVNGTASSDYTQDFIISITISNSFIPVTSISGVPTTGTAGEALTLGGTVSPGNATNKAIVWLVKSAGSTGAVINGNTLTAAAGTVTVTATIVNGQTASSDYTQDFTISITSVTIQYTITFNRGEGNGSAPANQTVNAGAAITLPAQGSMTAPSGKVFAGWQASNGGTYAAGASYTPSGSVTFTAQWNTIQYTITFNRGEGNGSAPANQTVNAGAAITLPAQGSMTAPSGKAFAGWQASNGGTYAAGASYTVSGSVTFTAQWITQYTITFNRGDGGGTAPQSRTVNAGTAITLPTQGSMTAPSGKFFMGWKAGGGAMYAAGASYTVNGSVTFTAQWTSQGIKDVTDSLTAASGGNSAANPVSLTLNLDLASDWVDLLSVIQAAGKYVALDLSACTMTGTEFDPGAANTGEKKIVSLVLPDMATYIKGASSFTASTFKNFTALTSVSGSGITNIDDNAFSHCDALRAVNFLKATSIGDYAFLSCEALATVNLPLATYIGFNAFSHCDALVTVSLPSAVTIGNCAFLSCDALTTVSLPAATSIREGAFANCEVLTTVSLPAATSIGKSAFFASFKLTTVNLPEAVTIGESAFYHTALTTVNIPKVTSIGDNAFEYTGSTAALTVTLGSAAPTLGVKVFESASYPNGGVIVKVPTGAAGYGAVPATYSGSDTTACWGNGFRGGGWNGSAFAANGSVNSNITLKIE
jgi:hypothetical protein